MKSMPARDEHGRFVKADITAKTQTDGPQKVVDPEQSRRVAVNPEFEKPVLALTVNNPIKKILYWLDQIRKHQTTTFAIKLSIPLIALPVLVFAAFQLGRGSYVLPFIKFSQTSPLPPETSVKGGTPTPTPYSRSGTLKMAKTGEKTKYVLALKNGENVLLDVPSNLDLSKYQNKLVLVTGIYDRGANLIKVTEIAEIEVINETTLSSPAPAGGPSPKPTPSESTTSAQ